jgi:hypothetical protein
MDNQRQTTQGRYNRKTICDEQTGLDQQKLGKVIKKENDVTGKQDSTISIAEKRRANISCCHVADYKEREQVRRCRKCVRKKEGKNIKNRYKKP